MRSVVISRSSGSHGSTLAREVAGVASAVARAAQNVANNDPIFASASSSSACADDPPQSPTPGRVVVVDNLPEPRLAPDCLQIRVEAASLNALDADMRRGYGASLFAVGGLSDPYVPGRDCAGTVVRIGNEARALARARGLDIGSPVIASLAPFEQGTFAELVSVSAANAVRKPEELTWRAAAALPYAGLTAYEAVRDVGRVGDGSRVLVHGGGGAVGSLAIQLSRIFGAAHVLATCSASDLARVKAYGARAVDYRDPRGLADVVDGGERFDVVLDMCNGGDAVLEASLPAMAPGSRYVTLNGPLLHRMDEFGLAAGGVVAAAELAERKWRLSHGPEISYDWCLYHPCGDRLATLAGLAADGRLDIHVDRTVYPLDSAEAAFDAFDSKSNDGKIVVSVS